MASGILSHSGLSWLWSRYVLFLFTVIHVATTISLFSHADLIFSLMQAICIKFLQLYWCYVPSLIRVHE